MHTQKTMRDAFFDKLYDIAIKDRQVMIVSADMGAPSLDKFRRDLGSQFINVGIAEQNMVTVATGLALEGRKVYAYAIMPFATLRCYEIIKVDLSLMNIPVTIVGVGAGFGYDDSGPTHHSTEDLSVMRVLPNMTILSPSDTIMTEHFAQLSYELKAPSYVRLDRQAFPVIYRQGTHFDDGLYSLRGGRDVCIISTGNMVHRALEVADALKKDSIDAGVIDLYRLKPVNTKLLLKSISKNKRIVTLEEHLLAGGLGSIISEIISDNEIDAKLKRIGIQDRYYYTYGGRSNIQRVCGLDRNSVAKSILKWLK